MLWPLCLSAPDVSCVAVFSERLETQREALRLAGIISSDKWRLEVLGRGLIEGFFSLGKTGSTTSD